MNGRLTGNVRVRVGLRGRLVLQVEFDCDDGPPDSNGMPSYLGVEGAWRDARAEDLQALGRLRTALGALE